MVDLHPLADYLAKPSVDHAPEALRTLSEWVGSGWHKALGTVSTAIDNHTAPFQGYVADQLKAAQHALNPQTITQTAQQMTEASGHAVKTFAQNHHLTGKDIDHQVYAKLDELNAWASPKLQNIGHSVNNRFQELVNGATQSGKSLDHLAHLKLNELTSWASPKLDNLNSDGSVKLQEFTGMVKRNWTDLTEGLPVAGQKIKQSIDQLNPIPTPEESFYRYWDELDRNAAMLKQSAGKIPPVLNLPGNPQTFLAQLPTGSLKV